MNDIQIEQLFLSALDTKHGVIVSTSDVEMLKKKCYSVRNKARGNGTTAYDCLSFRTSPTNPTNELWICIGEKKNAAS